MQRAHFIVEQHPDGFIASPLGVVGVVIGQGETSAAALEDARSAPSFHIETFGADVLKPQSDVLNVFIEEAEIALA